MEQELGHIHEDEEQGFEEFSTTSLEEGDTVYSIEVFFPNECSHGNDVKSMTGEFSMENKSLDGSNATFNILSAGPSVHSLDGSDGDSTNDDDQSSFVEIGEEDVSSTASSFYFVQSIHESSSFPTENQDSLMGTSREDNGDAKKSLKAVFSYADAAKLAVTPTLVQNPNPNTMIPQQRRSWKKLSKSTAKSNEDDDEVIVLFDDLFLYEGAKCSRGGKTKYRVLTQQGL